MVETRKVFVGSSSEGYLMAEVVGDIIRGAGMEPMLWRDIFPAGDILLEKIEHLPGMVDGAVLLATPDLQCTRQARGEEFLAPVANVVFEYGYLSGRLSRKRVAICAFDGADMPSDLQGMTVVQAGSFERSRRSPLRGEAESGLERWLATLVPLPIGVPPMRLLHGYSGRWEVQNRFSIWHGIEVVKPDLVTWEGETILHIQDDGQAGHGSQIGELRVALGPYRALWRVANEVISAVVGREGTLSLRVQVCARALVEEAGTPPSMVAREELPSKRWDLALSLVDGEPRKLKGRHSYSVAGSTYSQAEEYYTHTIA